MSQWKLVDVATGAELNIGDLRTTFRGEEVRITSLQPPHKPESTGKVNVNFVCDDVPGQYYPGVIGARYVEISLDDAKDDHGKIDRLLGEFFLRPKQVQ